MLKDLFHFQSLLNDVPNLLNSWIGAFLLLDNERRAGACVWIPADKPTQFWPTEEEKKKYRTILKKQSAAPLALPPPVPSKFQKV